MYGSGMSYLSALRHRLAAPSAPNAFTSQKTALVRWKPWMRFSQGLHDAANVKVFGERAYLAHFKYHAGFAQKVRTEVKRRQHFDSAAEYQRYAVMLAEMKGGFGLDSVSNRYKGSSSFVSLDGKLL
jgi:hypothetical protein